MIHFGTKETIEAEKKETGGTVQPVVQEEREECRDLSRYQIFRFWSFSKAFAVFGIES